MLCSRYAAQTLWLLLSLLVIGCETESPQSNEDDFFERQNAAHNGDYLATYPLSDPDSCIAQLKREVPPALQPWGCLSLWYHMPRDRPEINFRLLDLYEKNYPHDTVFAFCQMMRAEFYVDLAKFDSAKICIDDAYHRYTKLGRPLDASDAHYLLARSYIYQNRFAEALETYLDLLDLLNAADSSFTERHANLYSDISVAYERSGNKAQYWEWLQKRWNADLSQLSKPWLYRARTAENIGVFYLRTNPDSSIFWTKKTQEIFQEANPGRPIPSKINYRLARAYFEAGKCETALALFLDAYRRNPFKGIRMVYYQVPMSLGECYLCLEKLDSAELYIKESLSSPDTGNLSVAHELLSEVYSKQGRFEAALKAAQESQRLHKIKFTNDKVKAVADVEARYEMAQKEHRIAVLEQEHQATRLRMLVGMLALLLAVGALVGLYSRQRGRRLILEQQNQILGQEKELVLAREQLQAQALEHSQQQLEATQTMLDSTARSLKLKNELIEVLHMKLSEKQESAKTVQHPLEKNPSFRSMKILTEDDWDIFRQRYEESYPGFLAELKGKKPNLTPAETRLFLLLKLNFENKEIADTLGISQQSVWRSRHRLSKKLGLTETSDLDSFIKSYFE